MNDHSTAIGLTLALLATLIVAGCAGRSEQQAQFWNGQYEACYGAAFPNASPPAAAEHRDTRALERCLAARGWTASS